jgi:hypothetical protein
VTRLKEWKLFKSSEKVSEFSFRVTPNSLLDSGDAGNFQTTARACFPVPPVIRIAFNIGKVTASVSLHSII